ncbi:hypothetical protein KPH14_008617 [Odynerus spinipes]|uniref:Uncharacterized protein n=1 Tax=Odynerus spinipes TaxID=1348599 RepID=A0AAD9VSB1_9HYME|nr:hypothetical protein KPH14_008617 [Odynerus spinipes]
MAHGSGVNDIIATSLVEVVSAIRSSRLAPIRRRHPVSYRSLHPDPYTHLLCKGNSLPTTGRPLEVGPIGKFYR